MSEGDVHVSTPPLCVAVPFFCVVCPKGLPEVGGVFFVRGREGR